MELERNFASMRELQAEMAPFLSSDGMFLPASEPLPADTVVRFRITLPEGFVLIEGTGVVIWTRGGADAHPPGMAIRYVSLAPEAQETIDAIIDSHLASGGDLFALEPDEDGVEGFPTDALQSGRATPPETYPARPSSTHQELEQARVTIRGEPGQSRQGGAEAFDDGSRGAAADDVEEPAGQEVGWGEDRGRQAPRFLVDVDYLRPKRAGRDVPGRETEAAGRREASAAERAAGGKEIGEPELPGVPVAPVADEEDDTVVVLEADPLAVAEEIAAAQARDEDAPAEAPPDRPGETAIPSFLESWKDEIADDDRPAPEVMRGVADRPESGHGWLSESFEGVGPAVERAAPGLVADVAEEDEPAAMPAAAAAPQPPDRARRSSVLWLLPVLAVIALAAGLYVEWDRVRELVAPPPADTGAPILMTDETAEAPAAAPSAEVVPVQADPVQEPERSEAPAPSAAEPVPAEGVPVPAPVEEEPVPAPEPLGPATAVEAISVHPMSPGTAVVVRTNGAVAAGSVAVFPMDDPPRILVRIRGIDEGYPQYEVAGGTREVEKVRIGHHPELRPPALYVVLDLTGPTVGVTDLAVDGDTVRVTVAAR